MVQGTKVRPCAGDGTVACHIFTLGRGLNFSENMFALMSGDVSTF